MRDRGFVHPHGSAGVLALKGPVCAARRLRDEEDVEDEAGGAARFAMTQSLSYHAQWLRQEWYVGRGNSTSSIQGVLKRQ